MQGDKVKICDHLEQYIINDDEKLITGSQESNDSAQIKELLSFGQKLKTCGMELSRENAQEFNQFITAALGE